MQLAEQGRAQSLAGPSQTRDLQTQQGDIAPNVERALQRRWTGVAAPVQQCRTDP